jgi:hypothetical protein
MVPSTDDDAAAHTEATRLTVEAASSTHQ